MDHLGNIVSNDDFRPRYLKNIYDPESSYNFHDFPEERAGWRANGESGFQPIQGMEVTPFRQFLQSWLFFGLLKTVIQLPEDQTFQDSQFVDGLYINTIYLREYLNKWADWEYSQAQKGTLNQSLRMIRAQVALDRAREVVLQCCSVDGKHYHPQENHPLHVDDKLSLSLMVFGETLTAAKSKVVQKVGFNIRGWHGDATEGWGIPNCIIKKMESADWCPRTIYMLKVQLRLHATSLLSAYAAHANETDLKQNERHKKLKCTEAQCNVKSVDSNGKYATQHHPTCPDYGRHPGKDSKCQMVGPDIEQVRRVLDGPYYPLMEYKEERGVLTVKVVPCEPHMKYATISHVWADGYGNPEENKLWECQLKFFKSLMTASPVSDEAKGKSLFWIDTLAIPVDKGTGEKTGRKTAIERIHDVYTNATYTIVIDNGLTQAESGTEYHRPAMKILASGWMRRLWTLQEAYLSKRLLFAFRDHQLRNLDDLEDMYPEANEDLTSNIPNAARTYFHNLLGQDRKARINDLPSANGFGLLASVWRAAQWRATSHAEHETLALATLLNVDNTQFISSGFTSAATSEEDSALRIARSKKSPQELEHMMKDLWSSLNETAPGCIPPGIIFLGGKRLSIKGFGWAPITWMSGQEVDYPDPFSIMTEAAVLMDKGLSVYYPGFLLHAKNYSEIVRLSGINDFRFPIDSSLLEWYTVSWKEGEGRLDNPPPGALEHKQLAIMLCRPRPRETPEIGLLVEIMKMIKQRNMNNNKESKVYHVFIIRRLKIKRELRNDLLSEWRDVIVQSIRQPINEESAINAQSGNVLIFGEVLDSNQKWYVDGRPKPEKEQVPREQPQLANPSPPTALVNVQGLATKQPPRGPKKSSYPPAMSARRATAYASATNAAGRKANAANATLPSGGLALDNDSEMPIQKVQRAQTSHVDGEERVLGNIKRAGTTPPRGGGTKRGQLR